MNATDAIMALHRQLDAEVDAYLRLALSRGEGLKVSLYIAPGGKVGDADIRRVPKRDECAKA
jgi:hypothetical protein